MRMPLLRGEMPRFLVTCLGIVTMAAGARAAEPVAVYVGTYTGGGSKGIYRFEFDGETGKPSGARLVAETPSPSFLAFAPDGKHLYAVNEVDGFDGKPGGSVSAFSVDTGGTLTLLNQQSSLGKGPCHLTVDRAGNNVLVANYGGGSAAVVPIGEGGRLGTPSSVVQHRGSSVVPGRQKEPHAHSINLDPQGKFAVVADLGLDKVLIYKFDPKVGGIAPNRPDFAATAPGAGPRHFAFHPSGKYAYVINELNSTVTAFNYDAEKGVLSTLQSLSTLPPGSRGTNYPADLHVHPNGRFLYGSNRGHNSIVAYAIDPSTGKLTHIENQAEGIKTPRNFTIDPTGKFLLVANQDANSVVVFRIDDTTGALKTTGQTIAVPKPVCLRFVPMSK